MTDINNKANENENLNKYHQLMGDIKSRYAWITGDTTPKNTETIPINTIDIECIALQVRKILENIAFLTMVSNVKLYSKIRINFHKDWNGSKILETIEKNNKDFYPEPIRLTKIHEGYFHFIKTSEDYLTRDDWIKAYDLVSGIIHQKNPFNEEKISSKTINMQTFIKIVNFTNKIVALLNSHRGKLENGDYVYSIMQAENTNNISVKYLKKEGKKWKCL